MPHLIQLNQRNGFSHALRRIHLDTVAFPPLRKSSRDMRWREEGCNGIP